MWKWKSKDMPGRAQGIDPSAKTGKTEITRAEIELWKISGFSKGDYQGLVEPILTKAQTFFKNVPGHNASRNRNPDQYLALLKHLNNCLRIREGQMLPQFAPVEEMSKLHPRYSYAVIAATALSTIGDVVSRTTLGEKARSAPLQTGLFQSGDDVLSMGAPINGVGLMLAHAYMPAVGLDFLYREKTVFVDFCAFFTDNHSIIGEIVRLARCAVPMTKPVPEILKPATNEKKGQGSNEIDTNTAPDQSVIEGEEKRGAAGWLFVAAVKKAIATRELTVNQDDSRVFVADDLSVVLLVPNIFAWYEDHARVAAKTAQNQFGRLNITRRNQDKTNYFKFKIDGVKRKFNGLTVQNGQLFFDGKMPAPRTLKVEVKS